MITHVQAFLVPILPMSGSYDLTRERVLGTFSRMGSSTPNGSFPSEERMDPVDDDDADLELAPVKVAWTTEEKIWRYVKKPLLRIGSKGATESHGNSLRELLEQHTVVKVKVNTHPFDGSLDTAFATLRRLAEQSGAVHGIELIQMRPSEQIILLGMPGTTAQIQDGTFPPAETRETPM